MAVLITSSAAFGGSVWNGNGPAGPSTSWNVAANWSSNAVPAQGDDVIIGTGFNSGTLITLNGPTSVRSLGIDGVTDFTIAGDSTSTLTIGIGTVNRKTGASGIQTIAANMALNQPIHQLRHVRHGAIEHHRQHQRRRVDQAAKRNAVTVRREFVRRHVTIADGTLLASNDAALGEASGTLTINSGAALGLFGANTISRPIVGSGTFTIDTPSGTTYLQGGVHGSGTLFKAGTGRMRFFGGNLNTFAGKIINSQGQLLTNPSHLNGNIDIQNDGEVQFSQTFNAGTYAGSISGTGWMIVGGGLIALTGTQHVHRRV